MWVQNVAKRGLSPRLLSPRRPLDFLATGKYGCRKVRVYPAECGEQLGRDPSKNGSSKSLVSQSFSGEGTLWDSSCLLPSHFGIRLYFVRPHCPSPEFRRLRRSVRKCFLGSKISGPKKKTMTARDVTRFHASFSARESGNFLHTSG